LTIVDVTEFERLVSKLDLSNLAAFRAVAYAAASHIDASQIRKLLPQAFELGDEYQSILRNAIEVASGPLAESAWEVTIDLVAQSKWSGNRGCLRSFRKRNPGIGVTKFVSAHVTLGADEQAGPSRFNLSLPRVCPSFVQGWYCRKWYGTGPNKDAQGHCSE
jgi:hypothetical protein